MAIATRARAFVSSPIVQTVVNDIYAGHVVYSVAANRSIVADNYKQRAIEIYDSRNASWLNHYRYIFLCVLRHDVTKPQFSLACASQNMVLSSNFSTSRCFSLPSFCASRVRIW